MALLLGALPGHHAHQGDCDIDQALLKRIHQHARLGENVSRERWAEAYQAAADSYWTPAREEAVTSGKKIPFLPGRSAVLLRALGLLRRDTSMPPDKVRKYRQINHMVAVLRPALRELMAREPVVRLIDAGCGRSYLSLLIAWWLERVEGHPVQILGVDRRPELLEESARRADLVGLASTLRFSCADLHTLDVPTAWETAFGAPSTPNGVVALHACDTASDVAISIGLAHDVAMIAVAPCCQAELAATWSRHTDTAHALQPLWSMPSLRREGAAVLTDALRTQLLRVMGYEASALEFVGTEHTPKNILIRASRRGGFDRDAYDAFLALKRGAGGFTLELERRLAPTLHRLATSG